MPTARIRLPGGVIIPPMMTSRRTVLLSGLATMLHGCGGEDGPVIGPGPGPGPNWPPPPPAGPPAAAPAAAWSGHGGAATHAARAPAAAQALNRVLWSTAIDLAPPYTSGGFLLIHYGSPVISAANVVMLPVKRNAAGAFRVEARSGATGSVLWQQDTDYILPVSSWTPSMNLALHGERLFIPAAGGRVLVRDQASSATGALGSILFYSSTVPQATLNAQIRINTPLTVDAAGNLYFGFIADANDAGLTSGFVRIAPDGTAIWRGASALAQDVNVTRPAMNCAPALSPDGQTLYVVVNIAVTGNAPQSGYLLALDSATLAFRARQPLFTPQGQVARVIDSASSSPTVGPDGDLYFGVLDFAAGGHNNRGWLLHFDAALTQVKTPGSFGWDDTPSIVPSTAVPSYTGTSPYLLLCKYNNYYGSGSGDGLNSMAVLDPNATQQDAFGGAVTVMREILTVVGPTPDPGTLGGRREWCVNTAVVDPATRAAYINNEDGRVYKWDFTSNTLSQSVVMNSGVGQAYTATAMGPDGVIYAINNAQFHAIGA
jgi:hypothetical protein